MNECASSSQQVVSKIEAFMGIALPESYVISPEDKISYCLREDLDALILERESYFTVERAVGINDNIVLAKAHISLDQCEGHFPGRPVVPLIRMCGAISQSGCILAAMGKDREEFPIAIGAGGSRLFLKTFIEPPVDLLVEVKKVKEKFGSFFVIDGKISFDGKCVAELKGIKYMIVPRRKIYDRGD